MGDPKTSSNSDNKANLLRQKSVYLKDFCRNYKSILHKWHSNRLQAPSHRDRDKFEISGPNLLSRTVTTKAAPIPPPKAFHAAAPAADNDDGELTISSPTLQFRTTSELCPISNPNLPDTCKKVINNPPEIDGDDGELQISSPTLLARTTSRIVSSPAPSSSSQRVNIPSAADFHEGSTTPTKAASPPVTLTTPIFFSQTAARRKAAPVEKKLECSLEELCFGCVKKINITRDAMSSSGLIIQKTDVLLIKVQPGWRKGTKITFEGKGDERPGALPADVIFEIKEKVHPLYDRKGDDLELGIEVPLVQALTGCTMSLPLLGGERMKLSIEDHVIYPGYEMIIPRQGMPRLEDPNTRGDLSLEFMVEFPNKLSEEQRSEVANVLEECF